jgi:histone deacetylase 6
MGNWLFSFFRSLIQSNVVVDDVKNTENAAEDSHLEGVRLLKSDYFIGFATNLLTDQAHCNEQAPNMFKDDYSAKIVRATKHYENHDRVVAIWTALGDMGYLLKGHIFSVSAASAKELIHIHAPSYLEAIQRLDHDKLMQMDRCFVTEGTYLAASTAAGAVLKLAKKLVEGIIVYGVAIVRPAGHHAEFARAQGHCFFNNVALAAEWLIRHGGMRRVAIVDWDVHAGNGQQKLFYERNDILTVSIHRYDDAQFYPSSPCGAPEFTGKGAGHGYNVNIAWNTDGPSYIPGDADYKLAFNHVVLPVLQKFQPQCILVAAGFDAAVGDPLGGLHVTKQGYRYMTHCLQQFGVPMIMTLEGGYNIDNLRTCVPACVDVLLNGCNSAEFTNFGSPHPRAVQDILRVRKAIKLQ